MYQRNFQILSEIINKVLTQICKTDIRNLNQSSRTFSSAKTCAEPNPCEEAHKPTPKLKRHSKVELRNLAEQRPCFDSTDSCPGILNPSKRQLQELVTAQEALKNEVAEVGPKTKVTETETVNCEDEQKYSCQEKTKKAKTINVAILGADAQAGQVLSFQLKQHPLVKKLYIHGDNCKDLAFDLNQIDTNCSVEGYNMERQMHKCLRTADIVVLMDDRSMANCYDDIEPEERFFEVADKITEIAEKCTLFCPRALVISCVQPICCTVPLIQEIFKQTPWAHPMKILGCVSPLQSRMNTIVARSLDLDPTYVHVPVIGGTDFQSLIPIISQTVPNPGLSTEQVDDLLEIIKEDFSRSSPNNMCEGYSIAQFIITIARGLTGDSKFVAPALLRSNLLEHVKFMVSTVEFGKSGIVTNYGIPKMTPNETRAFQRAVTILLDRQKLVKNYVQENLNNGNFRYCI